MKSFTYKQDAGYSPDGGGHSEKLDGLWPHIKETLMHIIGMGKKGGDEMDGESVPHGTHPIPGHEAEGGSEHEGHPKLKMLMAKLSGGKHEPEEDDEMAKPHPTHGFGKVAGSAKPSFGGKAKF